MPKKDDAPDDSRTDQQADVDLTPHPLVQGRQGDLDDIKAPPDVVSLIGYIGPSKSTDTIRLYQDLTFHNYYTIPTEGIASTSPINADDENSPTLVQVYADTKVEVVRISTQSVEARYLSGSISSGALGGAAASPQAAAGQQFCGNITTYMPSCVGQPLCLTVVTANPTDCGQGCNPNCVATVVTSGVPAQAQAVAAQTLCTNITTHIPSCVHPPPCTNITTHVPSCIGPLPCTNITTHVPSCIHPPFCTNITTHMPSCVAQQAGAEALAGQRLCGNITTYMPSCVGEQPLCLTVVTANPTDCGQPCNLNCIATIVTSGVPPGPGGCVATIVTSGVDPRGAALGAQPLCGNITTYMPSCVAQQGGAQAAAGQQFCGNITTHMPSCLQPPCTNITTHVPSCVGPPQCTPHCVATIVTSHVGTPQVAQAQAPQAAAPLCITLHTHFPSWCPPPCVPVAHTLATTCTQVYCHPIANTAATLCTQHITLAQAQVQAQAQAQPQAQFAPICVTIYTGHPTCNPPCITLFTHHPSACPPICVTIYTGHPTWCPPCQPIAQTAATLCTQIHGGLQNQGAACVPTATVIPTGGGG